MPLLHVYLQELLTRGASPRTTVFSALAYLDSQIFCLLLASKGGSSGMQIPMRSLRDKPTPLPNNSACELFG